MMSEIGSVSAEKTRGEFLTLEPVSTWNGKNSHSCLCRTGKELIDLGSELACNSSQIGNRIAAQLFMRVIISDTNDPICANLLIWHARCSYFEKRFLNGVPSPWKSKPRNTKRIQDGLVVLR